MRKARLLRHPLPDARPLHPAELGAQEPEEDLLWNAMLHFRHRCDEAWYENLIESAGLEGKKLTPKRVRKLLLKALELYREASE